MNNTCAIILAAGTGTRMKSNMPKVLSKVLFKPILKWILDTLKQSKISPVCVVTGYKSEVLVEYLMKLSPAYQTVLQEEQKGTAHAVLTAKSFLLDNIDKDVLILNGDAPFIDAETIKNAYNLHKKQSNSSTVISAKISNPFGYGRIVRENHTGNLAAIVEQKDSDVQTQKINEVNSGAYWFNTDALLQILSSIKNDNAQGEFYLTDAIRLLLEQGHNVNAYISDSEMTVLGANNPVQLSELNNIARSQILKRHMSNGVNIPCRDGIIIADSVKIGQNTCILPGSIITGNTVIGTNCTIGPNAQIEDCTIGNNLTINAIHCANSRLLDDTNLRPFSVIKNNTFV